MPIVCALINGSSWSTRRVDGACVFLNRPGFAGGAGCALHILAMRTGASITQTKPEVCWQLPLRRLDDVDPYGHVTSTIREWKRRDWGSGGAEFHWWCTEATDAFIDKKMVWQTMADELTAIVGEEVYEELAAYMKARGRRAKAAGLVPGGATGSGSSAKPVSIGRKRSS
jgi:hypothetical protein